jgi:hypothetical protein
MLELINIACRANTDSFCEMYIQANKFLSTISYDRPPSRPASINVNTIANRIKRR